MTTPKLALPELVSGQSGKELTHNQALAALDQMAMPRVVDKDLSTPPVSPANGAMYIVGASPTGAWAGKTGNLAWWLSSANTYTFLPPGPGMSVRVLDEPDTSGLPKIYAYSGSAWIEQPVSSFTGGTLTSALNEAPIVTLASASTVSIGGASANTISISGTTAIIAFDVIAAGPVRRLVFQGALTLTHHSTAQILPGGANITTAAGDVAEFVSLGSGNWRCINYMRANGQAVASASGSAQFAPVLTEATTARTSVLADAGSYLRFTNAAATTYTVQPQSSVTWTSDAEIHVRRAAAANLTLTAGAGVTLNVPSGGTLVMTNAMSVTLKRVAADVWDVIGQTVAA